MECATQIDHGFGQLGHLRTHGNVWSDSCHNTNPFSLLRLEVYLVRLLLARHEL
jgi:hypothetical protein